MRLMNRLPGAVSLLALLGLSACATYNPAYGGLPFPLPGNDRYDRRGDYGDYNRSSEWRRVDSDAARYANEVDRAIRLSSGEERAVARVVRDRARSLLQRTHPSEHRYVYPFPRNYYGDHDRWWDGTDRAVERVLSSRSRRAYRAWVSGDYYRDGYDNRDGYYGRDDYYDRDGYDDRDRRDDDYRGRRYEDDDYRRDDRDNRDDRGNRSTARRTDARRDALEVLRRRQADSERQRIEARRESERRQADARRQASERRQEEVRRQSDQRRQEDVRRQDNERRQNDARRGQQETRRRQAQQPRESPRRQQAETERRGNSNRSEDRSNRSRDDDGSREEQQEDERGQGRRARPQRGN